jgi:hypothetical protein
VTRLSFEGPTPGDDEIAAILAVIASRSTTDFDPAEGRRPSAWTLAGRLPELDVDEVRAAAVNRVVR